jgi:hypothetical protein
MVRMSLSTKELKLISCPAKVGPALVIKQAHNPTARRKRNVPVCDLYISVNTVVLIIETAGFNLEECHVHSLPA